MKCSKCGFENKEKAKFCTKCGNSLAAPAAESSPKKADNSKFLIIGLVVVILILVSVIGYFALNMTNTAHDSDDSDSASSGETQSVDSSDEDDSSSDDKAKSDSSSKSKTKSWESIGSYSGSGSGSKTIKVPAGKIKVELSSFPIKNYATNHLYVTGSNGESGGVDWGSTSPVESRSDSFTYTSSSEETFTIDYYETVSWDVEFYRYQ